ncbi:hypothetical protein KJ611_04120 [Patescibacteria group bacterium]|nr:hypothetical protein [Patescibacteria group bacterium]MBU1705637.1 hypothetical protein [Patescibacteria group bacterium]
MPIFDPAYWSVTSIDQILYQILVWFGWIPIAIVLFWGFAEMWKNYRQGIYAGNLPFILLAINVPALTEQSPKALENFFANLVGSKSTLLWKEVWMAGKTQPVFSLEIASTEGRIQFFLRTQARFRDMVEAGIYAEYPEAEIDEVEDYMAFAPETFPDEKFDTWGTEFKLKKADYFPIRTFVDFEDRLTQELKDPLGSILEHLAKMGPGEHFWIQFLIQPADNEWKDAGIKFINESFGKVDKKKSGLISQGIAGALSIPNEILSEATGISLMGAPAEEAEEDIWKAFRLTPIEKMQADAVLNKVSKIGYHTKVRLVYLADKRVYNKAARAPMVKGLLNQYANLNLNAYGLYGEGTPKDDYFWQKWSYPGRQSKLVSAIKSRSWGIGANPGILSTEELATLWHFPTILIKAPLVEKAYARRGEPPVGLPQSLDYLGLPEAPGPAGPPVLPTQLPAEDFEEIPAVAEKFEPAVAVEPAVELPHPERPTQPEPASENVGAGEIPPNLPI